MIDTEAVYSLAHSSEPKEGQMLLELQAALHLDQDVAWNAQAYLEARKISLETACCAGVAYVPPGAAHQYGEWIRPWEDCLLFPLISPIGCGFTGRLIRDWQSCRDAAAHQARLRATGRKPWISSIPGGWFWDPYHLPTSATEPVVIVEGPLDRLALLACGGFEPGEVIALVGMSFQPTWLEGVKAVLFALHSGNNEASKRLKEQRGAIRMDVCHMPARGPHWGERWRREGADGLEVLYARHALLAHDL